MTALLSAFVGCILQGVVESKNDFLVYNPVSVSVFFNIKSVLLIINSHKNSLFSPSNGGNNVTKTTITNTHCFPILNSIIKYYCYVCKILFT